jgi:RNA polymerase sigma-70 factor (ECF subfamily)
MESTSPSLLQRLRQPGQTDAWERFARLYTPLLVAWSRRPRYGLQPADADDLVQDILTDLFRKLPQFHYDPERGFRGWLRGIFHHKWVDHCRRAGRVPPGGDEGLSEVASPAAMDPAEVEEQQLLLRRALELMQEEFEPTTWQACWQRVAEGRPGAEVAAALGMTENAVHVAKSRVLRRLRQEMAGLID